MYLAKELTLSPDISLQIELSYLTVHLVRCKGTGTDIFWLGPAKPCMRMEAQFNSNFLWFKSLASAYKPAINSWPVRLKFELIVAHVFTTGKPKQ